MFLKSLNAVIAASLIAIVGPLSAGNFVVGGDIEHYHSSADASLLGGYLADNYFASLGVNHQRISDSDYILIQDGKANWTEVRGKLLLRKPLKNSFSFDSGLSVGKVHFSTLSWDEENDVNHIWQVSSLMGLSTVVKDSIYIYAGISPITHVKRYNGAKMTNFFEGYNITVAYLI